MNIETPHAVWHASYSLERIAKPWRCCELQYQNEGYKSSIFIPEQGLENVPFLDHGVLVLGKTFKSLLHIPSARYPSLPGPDFFLAWVVKMPSSTLDYQIDCGIPFL